MNMLELQPVTQKVKETLIYGMKDASV